MNTYELRRNRKLLTQVTPGFMNRAAFKLFVLLIFLYKMFMLIRNPE